MILFLDIENTIIDNLTDCNWLEENCKKIKDFILQRLLTQFTFILGVGKRTKKLTRKFLTTFTRN